MLVISNVDLKDDHLLILILSFLFFNIFLLIKNFTNKGKTFKEC